MIIVIFFILLSAILSTWLDKKAWPFILSILSLILSSGVFLHHLTTSLNLNL